MDRWILPTRQTDIPGRDLVAQDELHVWREVTFLALVSLYLVATIALPLFAAGQIVVDLGDLLNLDAPSPLQLSLGVLLFPLAICASQLVCELYSARRAGALVIAGAFVSIVIVGVQLLANGGEAIVPAVALIACSTVVQGATVLVYSASRAGTGGRNLGLRIVLSAGLGQLLGWSAFIIVLGTADLLDDAAVATAMSACVYTAAAGAVAALPLMLVRRLLATYLRVGRSEHDLVDHRVYHEVYARKRLPPALIVEEPEILRDESATIIDLPFRPELHPFTTGEMRFFADGDALETEHEHDYS